MVPLADCSADKSTEAVRLLQELLTNAQKGLAMGIAVIALNAENGYRIELSGWPKKEAQQMSIAGWWRLSLR